jgi:tRNA U54 and U55 pseudouridine synthase Pus10
MRILKLLSAVTLSGLLLAGCASVAHVEKDDSVNFSTYHTYTWVDAKDSKNDSVKTKVSDLTERKIKEAVNAELAKTGWKESKHKPDVLISYDVVVDRGVKEDADPVYSTPFTRYVYNPYNRRWVAIYYPSQFMGYDRNQRSVREGTVTISVIDAQTEKTVWQGWTTDEVNSKNLTSKEIQNAVKSIFRKFDVAKR